MAGIRQGCCLALSLMLCAAAAMADQPQDETTGLYDRPVLVVDPGMHTAPMERFRGRQGPLGGDRLVRQDGAGLVVCRRRIVADHPPARRAWQYR